MGILGFLRKSVPRKVVMIVDNEDGVSRLLSIDDSGVTEWPGSDMDAVEGQLAGCDPDLILVNPDAFALHGENLVQELNRRASFQAGYAWEQAPGELPA